MLTRTKVGLGTALAALVIGWPLSAASVLENEATKASSLMVTSSATDSQVEFSPQLGDRSVAVEPTPLLCAEGGDVAVALSCPDDVRKEAVADAAEECGGLLLVTYVGCSYLGGGWWATTVEGYCVS